MVEAIRDFFAKDSANGIVLMIVSVLAIVLANTPGAWLYDGFLELPVEIRFANLEISKSLLQFINDGLMAVFFLLVGLEVKRELMEGALSRRDQAIFPALAALGGMLAPALLFLLVNGGDPVARNGWAIPAATDIVFALGVMALLGPRVPTSLKVFLLALAIIDDLGVIVIIALFYTSDLSSMALGIAAIATVALFVLNQRGVGTITPYVLLGVVLWVAVLKSGVHATLAGVLVAFAIPMRRRDGQALLDTMEHSLQPWVNYMILPLFAFANAGISLHNVTLTTLSEPLPLGIILGLVVGKPLGIFLICWLTTTLGIARLPEGTNLRQVLAVALLCGIGFTMSIFIASLAFEVIAPTQVDLAKLGILTGSVLAAGLGYWALHKALPAGADIPSKVGSSR